jgi:hypothetical protein
MNWRMIFTSAQLPIRQMGRFDLIRNHQSGRLQKMIVWDTKMKRRIIFSLTSDQLAAGFSKIRK